MNTEIAHARNDDRKTSHDAAKSVTELPQKQRDVLKVFNVATSFMTRGLTDEQLVNFYDDYVHRKEVSQQSQSGIRSRRNELTLKGYIVDSGKTRPTKSGRQATVWKLK